MAKRSPRRQNGAHQRPTVRIFLSEFQAETLAKLLDDDPEIDHWTEDGDQEVALGRILDKIREEQARMARRSA